jgi:oligoendopeptidase F
MSANLPRDWNALADEGWDRISAFADDLLGRGLSPETIDVWMTEWSRLARFVAETYARLFIRTTTHTDDESGQLRFRTFSEDVMPKAREFEQGMLTRLLESGLKPREFDVPLRRIRSDADLFRSENLALKSECERLEMEFCALTGARSIDWDGRPLSQAEIVVKLSASDRETRERAWMALSTCLAGQRVETDRLWVELLGLRARIADNAGFPDYRSYRWQELGRFDYTPADCHAFAAAIEEVVVPAVGRLAERRRHGLALDSLRIWDDYLVARPDPKGLPALAPFESIPQLTATVERIFASLDPALASYFRILEEEGLLDLDVRGEKAQGAYMEELPASGRAFIFESAVGSHDDVIALLHESGHTFHAFEAAGWPYHHQSMLQYAPMEFIEFASMAMELLASPYLDADRGGFYTRPQLAQARCEHLTQIIESLPYVAVVDEFQHWVYENPEKARDTGRCDERWAELHRRFMPHLEWTGIEDTLRLCWRLQEHIVLFPFYFVEYGMAQLGAVHLWANALQDGDRAVAAYRRALSLGNTATLPDLYRAAGVEFDFGRDALVRAVDLIERTIDELENEY